MLSDSLNPPPMHNDNPTIALQLSHPVDRSTNPDNEAYGLFQRIESTNHLDPDQLYAIGSLTEEHVYYIGYGSAIRRNHIIKGLGYQKPLYVFNGTIFQTIL